VKKFKKFSISFVIVIALFVLYNFIVWNFYTKQILTTHNGLYSGDLVRMGYISGLAKPKKTRVELPKQHIEAKDYYDGLKVDMITIGDSFSNGGGGGLNPFYQDYITTYLDYNVLNLQNYQEKTRSYIETTYLLANSGFLKKAGVKYVLLESIQRKVVQRFVQNINTNINETLPNIYKTYKFKKNKPKQNSKSNISKKDIPLPQTKFINNGNIKLVTYNILYNFSDHAFISTVYKAKLTKDLFVVGNKDLLFYKSDLSRIHMNNMKNIEVLNKNLNDLATFLKKQGIELIFMPAVNKYDLYFDYIANNKYPKDPFFDNLRKLKKEYIFVDTKKILSPLLKKGVKEVYHVDDTHWSSIASSNVIKNLANRLKN
jgi:hypothetical protein